jgi:hypothetical protein
MKCGNICISFTAACAFLSRILGPPLQSQYLLGLTPQSPKLFAIPPYEYSSQLLSPMGAVRRRMMARVVMMAVVRIITTKVE